MLRMAKGFGGVFQFNVEPHLLDRAADEADSIAVAMMMSRVPGAADLGGRFFSFARLFRERRANPDPSLMDVSHYFDASDAEADRTLEILEGLAGRQLTGDDAPTNQVWRQFRAAIIAQRRARERHPDDQVG